MARWTPIYYRYRALWIFLHCLSVALVAFPAPRALTRSTLKKASVQAELAAWHRRGVTIGWDIERPDFDLEVTKLSASWAKSRRALVLPFRSYLDAISVGQGWYMFTAPDRAPERFRLDWSGSRRSGKSSPKRRKDRAPAHRVFEVGRDPARPDIVAPGFLEHHRVRRAFLIATWSRNGNSFADLCAYFAVQVTAHEPRAKQVHCSLIQEPVLHPATPQKIGKSSESRRLSLTLDKKAEAQ